MVHTKRVIRSNKVSLNKETEQESAAQGLILLAVTRTAHGKETAVFPTHLQRKTASLQNGITFLGVSEANCYSLGTGSVPDEGTLEYVHDCLVVYSFMSYSDMFHTSLQHQQHDFIITLNLAVVRKCMRQRVPERPLPRSLCTALHFQVRQQMESRLELCSQRSVRRWSSAHRARAAVDVGCRRTRSSETSQSCTNGKYDEIVLPALVKEGGTLDFHNL